MSLCRNICCLMFVLPLFAMAENNDSSQSMTKTDDMDRIGQVYSDQSIDSVNAINRIASKLRDPTRISDSFRSALKRMAPQTESKSSAAAVLAVPEIELAAILDGYGKERTALIRLSKDRTHMVRKGQSFTIAKRNIVYEIYVEDIGLCEIKLNVNPPNQLLILR